MALPASGKMSLGSNVNVELGNPASTLISLGQASVRSLYGVASGAIRLAADGYGKSGVIAFSCATYTTAGSYTFTVPSGVSKISVVCVGGGGGAGGYCSDAGIGYGGSTNGAYLSYTNCIPVTAGENLTVVVGNSGVGGCGNGMAPWQGTSGGNSYISRGGTTLIQAKGSVGGGSSPPAGCNVGAVTYTGGTMADHRGGGAAGYAGNGGNAGSAAPPGGGGGGGAGPYGSGHNYSGGGGGGVGLIVQGPSGGTGVSSADRGGRGGSGGANGIGQSGGSYGGGAGDHTDSSGGNGGSGGLRIIYGGTGKSYPNNSAP